MVTITKMRKVSEILHTMTLSELNEVISMCRDIKVMKAKADITVGMRVYVVQKTKKTPGTVVKINKTRALVDMVRSPITGETATYQVPFSMLEAA
tara:strand:+ start:1590 stop:1874 length:285 start_codon:yes stop_codon:yes gene_type:complete